MKKSTADLSSRIHSILEQFERLSQGLQEPRIGASKQTADRIALHVALCLHGWPWQEAETFALQEFPRDDQA